MIAESPPGIREEGLGVEDEQLNGKPKAPEDGNEDAETARDGIASQDCLNVCECKDSEADNHDHNEDTVDPEQLANHARQFS